MPGTGASGGRNAKSSQAHVLSGTFRADRHGASETPEAPRGRPEPPLPLEGLALGEWDRMLDRLEACGTLSTVHDAAIYQYCRLFADTEVLVEEKAEAKEAVARLDESFGEVERKERIAFFIEVGKMRKLAASYDGKIRGNRMALRQYLVEFGLTPAAQSRVKVPAAKAPQSAVAAFRAAKA